MRPLKLDPFSPPAISKGSPIPTRTILAGSEVISFVYREYCCPLVELNQKCLLTANPGSRCRARHDPLPRDWGTKAFRRHHPRLAQPGTRPRRRTGLPHGPRLCGCFGDDDRAVCSEHDFTDTANVLPYSFFTRVRIPTTVQVIPVATETSPSTDQASSAPSLSDASRLPEPASAPVRKVVPTRVMASTKPVAEPIDSSWDNKETSLPQDDDFSDESEVDDSVTWETESLEGVVPEAWAETAEEDEV